LLGLTLVGCSSGSSGGTEAEDLVIESFSVDNESPLYIALGTVGQEVIDYYLDSQVEVKLSNGDTVNADIVWEVPDDYDSQIEGSYIFKGIYDIKDVGNGELEVEVILSDEVTSISGYVSIDYDFSDLSTSVSSVEVYEAESASTSSIADSEENKLIIGFSPHSKKVERMNLVEKHGAQLRKNLSSLNAAAVTVSTDVDSFIKNINKSKIVEYVEKDQKAYAVGEVVPDDNYYSEQWNLKMTALNYSWYNEKGNSDIKIAVIDTGINVNHPDLTDKIDIENSYNFVDDSSNIADKEGHGTHVAGTAAASTNNTEGIAGVGWNSKILALKALENGSGYHSDIAEAIMYAAGLSDDPKRIEAVDVINMSLGSSSENETLKNAVSKAAEAGVILVAAAGNNGSGLNYPAAYEEVISVAAVDSTGNIADFSNAGSGMDLAAPGQSILSTVPNKDYDYFSGTSMAAPHVSGVISLMLAEGISPYDIRESLHQASVHPGEESYSTDYGYGIINSSLALSGIDKIKIIIGQRQGSSFEKEAETSISIKGGRYSFPNLESGIYSIYTWIDTNQDNIINTGDYLNEHSNKGYSPGKSYIEDLTTHIDYDKSIK
jgi:subtilisin family serine protease